MPCKMSGTNDWPLAEIVSIKDSLKEDKRFYYVHYVDCEWELSRLGALGADSLVSFQLISDWMNG